MVEQLHKARTDFIFQSIRTVIVEQDVKAIWIQSFRQRTCSVMKIVWDLA